MLWVGYGDKLLIYELLLEESETDFSLRQIAKIDLPAKWIENLTFFNEGSHVMISAPDDGKLLVYSVEQLLGE